MNIKITGLILMALLVVGCGGIRPPGLLTKAQIEELANKVDSSDDPEAIWADNISEQQWYELKRFIAIYSARLGYRRGWREGWEAKTKQIQAEEDMRNER